jgi:ectoine hydroxylase-related dioxygenase (phytanoyl-CoA dioxygenase family)
VTAETGGLHCVPELVHTFEEWKKRQPDGRGGFRPNVDGFDAYPVPMRAGDLMIFNSLLAHGIRPNTCDVRVGVIGPGPRAVSFAEPDYA